MKRITLAVLATLCSYFSTAQTDSLRIYLDNLFYHLDKSQIPSGYLAAYGSDFIDKNDFNGQISDSNSTSSMDLIRLLYADLVTSRIASNSPIMASYDAFNTTLETATPNDLVIVFGAYSDFKEDALNQQLLTYQNGQLFDVPNRASSPYLLKKTIAICPRTVQLEDNLVILKFNTNLVF